MKITLAVPILHPSILILTKLQRWRHIHTSTQPKTKVKAASDSNDIEFLIRWMSKERVLIAFDRYEGKSRVDLLKMVRIYWDRKAYEGSTEIIEVLKTIMMADDVQEITRDQERHGSSVTGMSGKSVSETGLSQ